MGWVHREVAQKKHDITRIDCTEPPTAFSRLLRRVREMDGPTPMVGCGISGARPPKAPPHQHARGVTRATTTDASGHRAGGDKGRAEQVRGSHRMFEKGGTQARS